MSWSPQSAFFGSVVLSSRRVFSLIIVASDSQVTCVSAYSRGRNPATLGVKVPQSLRQLLTSADVTELLTYADAT
jgi:hypothetical protein